MFSLSTTSGGPQGLCSPGWPPGCAGDTGGVCAEREGASSASGSAASWRGGGLGERPLLPSTGNRPGRILCSSDPKRVGWSPSLAGLRVEGPGPPCGGGGAAPPALTCSALVAFRVRGHREDGPPEPHRGRDQRLPGGLAVAGQSARPGRPRLRRLHHQPRVDRDGRPLCGGVSPRGRGEVGGGGARVWRWLWGRVTWGGVSDLFKLRCPGPCVGPGAPFAA